MKKLLIITAFILAAASDGMSQTSADALRYSRIDIGGTARYMGLSGAFGALGADFTLASTNPAGLGLYKTSEIIITPAVHIGSVGSEFNGTTYSDQRTNFYLGNAGMVLTSGTKSNPNTPGWRYISFATGVNRLSDFNRRYDMASSNSTNSLLDIYVNDAYGIDYTALELDPPNTYGPYDLSLAWYDWLLDLKNPDVNYEYVSPIRPGANKMQAKYIESWGSMNEYVFSFAGNYNDRLYLGMTLGIPMIRYYESSVYSEYDIQNSNLIYFDRYDDLETHGAGFNFKLGMIYRVNDWLRAGVAYHSPSWFGNMRDYYISTMVAEYYESPDPDSSLRYYVRNSPSGYYEYNLRTPWRLQGNLGFIIGNVGAVGVDYEMVDYSKANLDAYDYGFSEENAAISNSYALTHNIRIGTEWRYNIFSFRAGARYFTSPYENNINDGSTLGFTGGVGLKQDWFFMDLAYSYSNMQDDYYFYNSSGFTANPVANSTRNHCILMTIGAKM